MSEKWVRKCNNCNTPMMEGYCIAGGEEYYCTDECLHKHITPFEFSELFCNGESDTYWTQWEEGEDE